MSGPIRDRREQVTEWLIERIAGLLDVDPARISPDLPFVQLGLSSMQAVQLAGELSVAAERQVRVDPALQRVQPRLVEPAHLLVDLMRVFLRDCVLEVRDLALDVQQRLFAHQVALVGDQLAGVLDELAPVFEVARSEREHAAVDFGGKG